MKSIYMFLSIIRNILFLYVLVQLSACANITSLTGGPKDTKAPVLISTSPDNLAVNIHTNTIIFTFNENIQINNPTKEIIISPKPNVIVNYQSKKNVFIIKFAENLQKNTTYQISLGNAIGDYNENNLFLSSPFIFSTGKNIDSFQIAGQIKLPGVNPDYSHFKVWLYHPGKTDLETSKPVPLYVSSVDASGNYLFTNLSDTTFNIFSFNDLNSSGYWDAGENIAFTDRVKSGISYWHQDTIQAFVPAKQISKNQSFRINEGRLFYALSFPKDSLLKFKQGKDTLNYFFNKLEDTLYVSLSKRYIKNPVEIFSADNYFDSIAMPENIKLPEIKILNNGLTMNEAKRIDILFNQPIDSFQSHCFHVDKIDSGLSIQKISIADKPDILYIYLSKKPSFPFSVEIDSGGVYGYFMSNKKKLGPFNINSVEALQSITVHLTPKLLHIYTHLELYRLEDNKVVFRKRLNPEGIKIEHLQSGKYLLRIFKDLNKNGRWDTGNFELKIHPEPMLYYAKTITIKPNWDTEIDF